MTLPIYFTGTVSVTNLGTTVTGVGVMWSGINAREGDFFVRADGAAVITEVTNASTLQITPWPGATVSGGTYAIEQNYVGRVVGVAAAEDVGVMLEKLHTDGLPFIVNPDETVPDPSYGDEGQFAFQPSTGKWWVKQGGVWVISQGLTALGYGGTSATSVAIGLSPPAKVFTTQTGLAYNGARVRAASAANLANFMEGRSTYSGTTLTMTCDLIGGSGTFADWLFSVAGVQGVQGPIGPQGVKGDTGPKGDTGASGAGTGNVNGPASAVADHIATFNGTTGTLIKDGGQAIAFVRYDAAQALTAGQQAQGRQNVYAAPFDALAYSGMQINGSMEVSQEAPGTVTTSGKYVCDGWALGFSGLTGGFASQDTAGAIPGFPGRIYLSVNLAKPSLAAGDNLFLYHRIEGYRTSRLGWGTASAQPITIGFWSAHSLVGTYSVAVRNSAFNRSYVATYTQNVASAAEYKTITIPGDTTGTWLLTNGVGIEIIFTAASGTTSTAPAANTWAAGGFIAAPGQVNIAVGASNFMVLTGVVVLPGLEAPSAARSPLIMRPYDQELLTCMRYYEKSYDYATALASNTAAGAVGIAARASTATGIGGFGTGFRFRVPKRAQPAMNYWSSIGTAGGVSYSCGAGLANVGINTVGIGESGIQGLYATGATGLTPGQVVELIFHYAADARL